MKNIVITWLSMKYILQSWGGFTFVCFCDLTVLLEIPLWVLLYWCIIEFACMCVLWSFPATGLIRLRKVLQCSTKTPAQPMGLRIRTLRPGLEGSPRTLSALLGTEEFPGIASVGRACVPVGTPGR